MKIALNCVRFGNQGGVERYVYGLVKALLGAGHEVHLFCNSWERLTHPRLHFHFVPAINGVRCLRPFSFAFFSSRLIRSSSFDLVHGFGKTYEQDVYSDGSGPIADFLEYLEEQATRWHRPLLGWSPYHLTNAYLERRRLDHPRLRKIICKSASVKESVSRRYPSVRAKLLLLYNGVDCEFYHPRNRSAHRTHLRHVLGIGENETVFLLVGNDYRRKNVRVALEAFSGMDRQHVKLIVAGRDRHCGRYQKLAEGLGLRDEIRFVGYRKDIERWYACADAFLSPSHYDVFPNAVLEAMATGIPGIVSSRSGSAEIASDCSGGLIVSDPNSPHDLAAQMRLLTVRSFREELGRGARRRALEFSSSNHYEIIQKIYCEVR